MFATIARLLKSNKPQNKKIERKNRSLMLEHMEDRKLMAVTSISQNFSEVYQTKQIWISGDNRASDVSVSLFNDRIVVKDAINGFNQSLSAAGIKAVVFMGGPGKDKVTHNISSVSIRAHGFGGDDTLIGHSAHDLLDGGDGNDKLYGNNGNDKLMGGAGVDKLFGGGHDDYLNGGAGADLFDGGSGYDTFRRSLTIGGFFATPPKDDDTAIPPESIAGAYLINDYSSMDSAYDIDQEATPTCSILAALSAVALKSNSSNDLVKAIRYDASKDQYGVKIWINDRWTTQWVNGDWTEGRDPGGKMWVSLYQKAYLQAWGVQTRDGHGRLLDSSKWVSTKGTDWQNSGNAMEAIAPGFSKYTSIGNADASTIRSQARDTKVYGMVASSKDSSTTSGVVANHAYVIVDAFTQSGSWMVRLYNPWGHDRSGSATDGKDDGIITLTWSQFKSNFNGYHRNV